MENSEERKTNSDLNQEWKQRYARFPPKEQNYLLTLEKTIDQELEKKAWVKTGLERLVWKQARVFPAYSSIVLKTFQQFGKCKIQNLYNANLHCVYKRKNQLTSDFKDRYLRIYRQTTKEKYHAHVLEFLVGLGLHKICFELRKIFKIHLETNFRTRGTQFDAFFELGYQQRVGVEDRNKLGEVSKPNAVEFKMKCRRFGFSAMMIAPFFAREAQNELSNIETQTEKVEIKDVQGFFSNIGHIYTAKTSDKIRQDFQLEGFENLVTFVQLDGWKDATKAIKWLTKHENEHKLTLIERTAEEFFEHPELSFLLRKLRGIMFYSLLKTHCEHLLKTRKEFIDLGFLRGVERHQTVLGYIPQVFLRLSYNPQRYHSIEEIIGYFEQLSWVKKESQGKRIRIFNSILAYLTDRELIEQKDNKWLASKVESPYLTTSSIF